MPVPREVFYTNFISLILYELFLAFSAHGNNVYPCRGYAFYKTKSLPPHNASISSFSPTSGYFKRNRRNTIRDKLIDSSAKRSGHLWDYSNVGHLSYCPLLYVIRKKSISRNPFLDTPP